MCPHGALTVRLLLQFGHILRRNPDWARGTTLRALHVVGPRADVAAARRNSSARCARPASRRSPSWWYLPLASAAARRRRPASRPATWTAEGARAERARLRRGPRRAGRVLRGAPRGGALSGRRHALRPFPAAVDPRRGRRARALGRCAARLRRGPAALGPRRRGRKDDVLQRAHLRRGCVDVINTTCLHVLSVQIHPDVTIRAQAGFLPLILATVNCTSKYLPE